MENYIMVENVKDEKITISIEQLYNLNYIEEIPTNPKTNEKMTGCIKADYSNNRYVYENLSTCS